MPKWVHHYSRKATNSSTAFSLISCLRMDQISWQYSCHLHNLKQRFKQLSSYFSCCELLFYPPILPYMSVCLWCVWFSQCHSCCHWCLHYSAWRFYAAAIPATCLKKKVESSPSLKAFYTHVAEKGCPRTESLVLNVSTPVLQIY